MHPVHVLRLAHVPMTRDAAALSTAATFSFALGFNAPDCKPARRAQRANPVCCKGHRPVPPAAPVGARHAAQSGWGPWPPDARMSRNSRCLRAWRPDAQRRQSRNTEPSAMIFLGKWRAVGKAVLAIQANGRRPGHRQAGVTLLPQLADDDVRGLKRRLTTHAYWSKQAIRRGSP